MNHDWGKSPMTFSVQNKAYDRIPLLNNWLRSTDIILKVLHESYRRVSDKYPNFRQIFGHSPILAFRRNKYIREIMTSPSNKNSVEASERSSSRNSYKRTTPCSSCNYMSQTNFIKNYNRNSMIYAEGGICKGSHLCMQRVAHRKFMLDSQGNK